MTEYSEDAAASLVRGLGAFIRVAQTQKLSPALRRLRSFRPQTLARHSDALLRALDDEELRLAVLEWLDDGQVPLGKKDAAILRTAAERPEGWELELGPSDADSSDGSPTDGGEHGRSQRVAEDRLAREREKVRAARSEARRIKEEARRRAEADGRKLEDLSAQLDQVTAALASARAAAVDAATEADRRVAAVDREARKAVRAARAAEARSGEDRKRLREVSREIGRLKRGIAELEAETERLRAEGQRLQARLAERPPASAAPGSEAGPRPARRMMPLAVPKGRMPEDPQTLAEWFSVPGVRLVVDGYNVTKAEGGYGDLPLERQRERLIDEVRTFVARGGVPTVIVFDGSEVLPGAARRMHGGVKVEYSKPSESADDHIIALLEDALHEGADGAAILTTNDRDLQERAAALGATIATSDQLLALIR